MLVYSVYMKDYSGESEIVVFCSEAKRKEFIKNDMEKVKLCLKDDGYEFSIYGDEDNGIYEIIAVGGAIYYTWEIYESILRGE